MEIKEGRANDLNDIVKFQYDMAIETEGLYLDKETLTLGVQAVLNDAQKGKYYLVEEGGQNIACLLTTYEWSEWRNGIILWIQSVYVCPEFRKKGVYTTLYQHIKEQVCSVATYKGIRLYADKTNRAAQQVYERLGMSAEHYQLYEWLKDK